MRRHSNDRASRALAAQQKGFTIVELMIAGALGLILSAGIIKLFIGSNQNYNLQYELANIQEDGRFAMIFLEDELQRGGWIDDFKSEVPPAIDLALSADGVTDEIAISYKTAINGVANRDCNGSVIADGYVTNQFYVGGASGEEFLCQGNGGGAAQPLIDGVKNFQVLYGVETNGQCPDGAVNQYMTHDQVVAAGTSILVVSVRVALMLGSERNVLDRVEAHTYPILDTQMVTNDQLVYRTFQQTIFMPNALYSTAGNPDKGVTCLAGAVGP